MTSDDGAPAPRPVRATPLARLVVVGAAIAVYFTLAPRWPKDNVVHVILGAGAARVEEVRVGYAVAPKHGEMAEDWTREASFRFPDASAPRVVTHEPRLADGEYVVEIEIVKANGASGPPHEAVTVDRHVMLQGGTTSIDVSEAVNR